MIQMRSLLLAASLCLLTVPSAQAHPHLFVDVSHTLLFDDQGRLVGLRARWSYDEMFSLLMVEDGEYDSDGDGRVTGAELARFQLWDADWPVDYGGDVEITLDGRAVPLQGPDDWAAQWQEGRAVSIHTRRLAIPLDITGAELEIRPYDPDFYVDYSIVDAPAYSGRDDCTGDIYEPDPDAVPQELADAIAELGAETTPGEAGLPAVGRLYAELERIRCGN